MNRIVLIIAYFGKFNNYFQLFLNSCEKNKEICDWIIFTDDKTEYVYPSNVRVVYISFQSMRNMCQAKFDFKIELNRPYKLCDYKPAYGFIFEDYLKEYEYWGHCDTDLIWGDIAAFWDDERIRKYDKIFELGHCTIYKNTVRNNKRFMSTLGGRKRYQIVYKDSDNCSFDEEYNNKSVNDIFLEHNFPILQESYMANIYTKSSNFRLTKLNSKKDGYLIEKKTNSFFLWDRGKLKRYLIRNHTLHIEEYLYIHMQSRHMKVYLKNYDVYKIIPNVFEDIEIPVKDIDINTYSRIKKKYMNLHYFRLRGRNLLIKIKKRVNQ